ncbi:unnamed protein product [Prunus armeniaca]|uniref:Uncharacterized protein n=1 Tax=Prunus armeniaca TaxID=36596 RepID=A0A6J5Y539_PRUAR|nr:unnamed protein product [Prunus armeniaca]
MGFLATHNSRPDLSVQFQAMQDSPIQAVSRTRPFETTVCLGSAQITLRRTGIPNRLTQLLDFPDISVFWILSKNDWLIPYFQPWKRPEKHNSSPVLLSGIE